MDGPTAYDDLINLYAEQYSLDPNLFRRLIQQESGFNPNAVSEAGAQGLGQVMPDTARDPGYGVRPLAAEDLMDPSENLRFTAEYLSAMLREFDNDTRLAVAAVNAGPGAVRRYNGVPPFEETQNYVRSILGEPTTRPQARPEPSGELRRMPIPSQEQGANNSRLDALSNALQYLDVAKLGEAPRYQFNPPGISRPRGGSGAQALQQLGIASLV
jgi:hypothetical protein